MSTRQREKAAARKEARRNRGPHATLRNLRMSARKVRLVVDLIRSRDIEEAVNILSFSHKKAALPIRKLLNSAIANADDRNFDLDRLFVKTAYVDEGPTMRRFMPRAQGRATRIRKRTSHITIELGEKAE